MHATCSCSPQDPVSLWGLHSYLGHLLTTCTYHRSSTPTRAFGLLKSWWPLHRDQNHVKYAWREEAGKGCRLERLQRRWATRPGCQGSHKEPSTKSKSTVNSVQSPPAHCSNVYPSIPKVVMPVKGPVSQGKYKGLL